MKRLAQLTLVLLALAVITACAPYHRNMSAGISTTSPIYQDNSYYEDGYYYRGIGQHGYVQDGVY